MICECGRRRGEVNMVKLHVKKGDESQFLHESTVETLIDDVIHDVIYIYNGRLKVLRICSGE